MRRIILVIFISGFALLAAVLLNGSLVQAQSAELSPEQLSKIKSNCTTIKSDLSQLHASDALLRVNRGQVYESMAGNLMDNFNSRLASNKLDGRAMTTVTGNYRSTLNEFRVNYIAYEKKLSEAIRIDCTQQPAKFYTTIQDARALRKTVYVDIQKLHRTIDDYRLAVGDFKLNYERISR